MPDCSLNLLTCRLVTTLLQVHSPPHTHTHAPQMYVRCLSYSLCVCVSEHVPEEEADDGLGRLRKPYHCDVCDADFRFTTAEALKHRRSCTGSTEESKEEETEESWEEKKEESKEQKTEESKKKKFGGEQGAENRAESRKQKRAKSIKWRRTRTKKQRRARSIKQRTGYALVVDVAIV